MAEETRRRSASGTFPYPVPRTPSMHLDAFRDLCLGLPGATEDLPFGPDALVFKVAGKMFALTNLERTPPTANLKCDPERAVELREAYADIEPGWHMNKRHWNTVGLQGDVPDETIRLLAEHSYALVVAGLPARLRDGIGG